MLNISSVWVIGHVLIIGNVLKELLAAGGDGYKTYIKSKRMSKECFMIYDAIQSYLPVHQ